jgi:SAM-dependent methyltransferase
VNREQPVYVCGHSASELRRLQAQGEIYGAITRSVLADAGLGPGMRVLDVGCGAGDVALLAAEFVGTSGYVLGVDRAPQAIAVARQRAAALGAARVGFLLADISQLATVGPFDALVGRFLLMHQAEPAAALRAAVHCVRPGGTVVMLESHLAGSVAGVNAWPRAPAWDGALRWMIDVLRVAGAHVDTGLRLHGIFHGAGLPAPVLRLHAHVEPAPERALIPYVVESVRSMLPVAQQLGIAALDVAKLDAELRAEARLPGRVLTAPLIVSAIARVA